MQADTAATEAGQVKRGRGRPRKYPLPEGYVPPPKRVKPAPASRPEQQEEQEDLPLTASGRPSRRARKQVDYSKLDVIAIEGEDVVDDVAAGADDEDADDEFVLNAVADVDDDPDDFQISEIDEVEKPARPDKRTAGKDSRPARERRTKESMEGKMQLYFGYTKKALLEGVKYRNKWVNELTSIRASMLESQEMLKQEDEHGSDQEYEYLDMNGAGTFLPPKKEISVEIGIDVMNTFKLHEFGVQSLAEVSEGRTGFVLNSGGHVADCQWAPSVGETQYIAISVAKEINAIFDTTASNSAIEIWRLNLEAGECVLDTCLLHSWGTSFNLRWCPVRGNIGTFAAAFQDGKVRTVRVPASTTRTRFIKLNESNVTDLAIPGTSITALTWMGASTLAVGTSSGYIGVFKSGKLVINTPVSYSVIFSIEAVSQFVLAATAADGYVRMLDIRDANTRASAPRAKSYSTSLAVVPKLNALVSVDDAVQTKIRGCLSIATEAVFAKLEGSVTCIAAGQCHPFTAVGGADGSVVYANPVARVLVNKKFTYKAWPQVRVWQLQYSEKTDRYRFVDSIMTQDIGSAVPSSYAIYPKNVGVTCLSWCRDQRFGGWIAAGMANGLVRIENLAVN